MEKENVEQEELQNDSFGEVNANIFVRLFAFGIDVFITLAMMSFLWAVFNLPVWTDSSGKFMNPILILFRVLYLSIFNSSKWMGTPGKMLMRLKVVSDKGLKLSFTQALGRSLLKFLSILFFGLGLLPAIFGKKTLYDSIMKTQLISKRADKNKEWKTSLLIVAISMFLLFIAKKIPANTEKQDRLNELIKDYRRGKQN